MIKERSTLSGEGRTTVGILMSQHARAQTAMIRTTPASGEELRNKARSHDASAGATTPSASLAIRSAVVNALVKRTFWLRG